jgi:hypothetical protein
MTRRDILKISTVTLAYSMSGAATAALLGGCRIDRSESWTAAVLTDSELALIAEIAERIIPATDTPGSKDAKVERYIDMALKNNYTAEDQNQFKASLAIFDKKANASCGADFITCVQEDQINILKELLEEKAAIFFEIKSLTVSGFFTSKEGATMVLKYDPIPGAYLSCVDLSEIGGRWAH